MVARQAHYLKVPGSIPGPATLESPSSVGFHFFMSQELTIFKDFSKKDSFSREERIEKVQHLIVKLGAEFCLYKDETVYMHDDALNFMTEDAEQFLKEYISSGIKIVYTSGYGLVK